MIERFPSFCLMTLNNLRDHFGQETFGLVAKTARVWNLPLPHNEAWRHKGLGLPDEERRVL